MFLGWNDEVMLPLAHIISVVGFWRQKFVEDVIRI